MQRTKLKSSPYTIESFNLSTDKHTGEDSLSLNAHDRGPSIQLIPCSANQWFEELSKIQPAELFGLLFGFFLASVLFQLASDNYTRRAWMR